MENVLAINERLLGSARWSPWVLPHARVAARELLLLVILGMTGALLVASSRGILGCPARRFCALALPTALGLAIVPRRTSGSIMAASGGLTLAALNWPT